MIFILALLLNVCLASFVTCFAERRQKGFSLWTRSQCMVCNRPISFPYLLPILGFFLAHRRCTSCQAPIPTSLFVIECIGLCNGPLIGIAVNNIFDLLLYTAFASLLLLMSFDDWHTQTIHDSDLWCFASLSFLYFLLQETPFLTHLLGALLISLPLFVLYYFYPTHLGSGDVFFLAIAGFLLGVFHIAYAFALGTFSALLYALFLLWTHQANRESAIPMIPFFATGVWVIFLLSAVQLL